jgi:hypothetical protein
MAVSSYNGFMIIENQAGAYLGPGPKTLSAFHLAVTNPHFDVLENEAIRLILGKCSRLPDDEDLAAGRYGIDFHRALPPFAGDSDFTCDWGDGPIPVNALNFARFLPRNIRFRQFTANLAFAARTRSEYEAKRLVYEDFYRQVYGAGQSLVVTTPHSGPVHRPPDDYHPFPESEIDAWTAGVAVRLGRPQLKKNRRLLVSLHSTDYFGAVVDIGDFGLERNGQLPEVVAQLNAEFADDLGEVRPAYRDHIVSYTQRRLQWKQKRWGTLNPERLATISTASRFEVMMLDKITGKYIRPEERFTYDGLRRGLEAYWSGGGEAHISLNGVFSGRKTARLLSLSENVQRAGFQTAVQVECSRFLARHYPQMAAAIITKLVELVTARLP